MSDGHSTRNPRPLRNAVGTASRKPYLLVGSGPLTATIWKSGTEPADENYRFNIIRISHKSGHVTQKFGPRDLRHLAKLVQVMAFTLADDGCVSEEMRESLSELAQSLERNLKPGCGETVDAPRR